MFSQSLNTVELSAPLPRWAVVASLVLIAVFTAIFVFVLPAQSAGDERATAAAVITYYE